MKRFRTSLLSVFMICSIICFIFGIGIAYASNQTATINDLSGVQIIGSSVRLDAKGIRFTMEMDSNEYESYNTLKTNDEFKMGILLFPTVGLTGDLTVDTEVDTGNGIATPQNVLIENTYLPKTVVNDSLTTYQFNVALTEIPLSNHEITSRGYFTDGTTLVYTNAYSNTVSRASASIYGMSEYAEFNTTLERNILEAYNEVVKPAENITNVDDISIEPTLNSVNSLVVGESNVAGYSDTLSLPEDLDNVFDYTVESSDKTIVSVGSENKLTAKKYGKAIVSINALGKEIGSLKVYAMDSDITKMGYTGVSSTHGTAATRTIKADNAGEKKDWNWAEDKKAYMNEVANIYLNGNVRISAVNANKDKVWWHNTECTWGDDAVYGKTITGYNAGGSGENVNAFMFNPLYTKEQIAMLMACGYDVINIPVKVNVSEDTINGTVLNGRNFINVYAPTERITGVNTYVGFNSMDDRGFFRSNKFFLNEWQEITISLKTLYDNFNQMLYFNGSTDGTNFESQTNYETRKYAWFTFANKTYGDAESATFAKTITFADAYLTKSSDSEVATKVNLNSNEFNEGLRTFNTNDDTFATYDTRYARAGSHIGRAQTTITDKNGVSKTANFVYMSNTKYQFGFQSGLTKTNGDIDESKIFLIIGKTKEQLQALIDTGYKYLTIDACFKLDADLRTDKSLELKTTNTLRTGTDTGTDTYSSPAFDSWTTWKISIKGMIEKYDALFNNSGTSRRAFIISRTNNGSAAAIPDVFYTLYMTGFEFTKA